MSPDDRQKIARGLRSDDLKVLMYRLVERQREEYSQLKGCSELMSLGRSQGRVDIIEWILDLRQEE